MQPRQTLRPDCTPLQTHRAFLTRMCESTKRREVLRAEAPPSRGVCISLREFKISSERSSRCRVAKHGNFVRFGLWLLRCCFCFWNSTAHPCVSISTEHPCVTQTSSSKPPFECRYGYHALMSEFVSHQQSDLWTTSKSKLSKG